ncbi:hypothetical protein PSMK_18970 [Phycisphaera mikurensis NBRC 102666]|uniref:Uncharacterized protein n=1 Tax=Phycisphaera mikurensis (strain NBRC 102666 / KCTC 22515 / FYK2301M01) TaxID=1142394 RepID=I0IFL8_PHYMF|nr:hypothetical protein PSMK_18970 [Phycisphaera mikurensis NBRC 102666]
MAGTPPPRRGRTASGCPALAVAPPMEPLAEPQCMDRSVEQRLRGGGRRRRCRRRLAARAERRCRSVCLCAKELDRGSGSVASPRSYRGQAGSES